MNSPMDGVNSEGPLYFFVYKPSLVTLLIDHNMHHVHVAFLFLLFYQILTLQFQFDISSWLSSKPALSKRDALLDIVLNALKTCGKHPSEDLESVFQVKPH